ncbi:MAG TPA: hypothetical protein VJU81_04815 [Methylomirabilota bacterium]|nr:hypothetical protein [Methylomirabilota bacterium]
MAGAGQGRIVTCAPSLFGGGLALGKLMFTTGLAASLAAGVVALTSSPGLWTLTAVAIVCGKLVPGPHHRRVERKQAREIDRRR